MLLLWLIPLTILLITPLVILNMIGRRATRPPVNSVATFLQKGRRPNAHTVVVCAGDSLTHATISGDYVALLRERFAGRGVEFVNAGNNNDTVYDLANRLESIIACQPDIITILIGINDVHPLLESNRRARYLTRNGLHPSADPLAAYRRQLDALIVRLQTETAATLFLISPPPLGEDVTAPANDRLRQYVEVIRAVADNRAVHYLPLNEGLTPVLARLSNPQPWSLAVKNRLIALSLFYHLLRGRSLNDLSDARGLYIHHDLLHLNERGAAIVARLIGDALTNYIPD